MGKNILEQKIEVYGHTKEGGRYIAMINGFDWVFRGPTPMAAYKRADDFRKAEWNKIAKKADRVPVETPKAKPKAPPEPEPEDEEVEP